nr:hypothetical protein B24B19.210 [imported] - Neurospora crassa [Neurospora crassa]
MAAGSITSSVTSTSQTITHDPSTHNSVMAATLAASSSGSTSPSTIANNPVVASFLSALADESNRHVFLQPPSTLPAGSLLLAKETLDALASQVSDHQQAKLKEIAATIGGKKRKREAGYDKNAVLKIRKLHVDDGFETEQIWQQAKKIIASATKEAGDVLKELEENGIVGTGEEQEKTIEFGEDGFELGSDEEEEDDEEDADSESGSGSEGEEDEEDDEEELEGEEGSQIDDDEEIEIDGEEDMLFSGHLQTAYSGYLAVDVVTNCPVSAIPGLTRTLVRIGRLWWVLFKRGNYLSSLRSIVALGCS